MLVMQNTSEIFLLAILLREDLAGMRTVSIEPLFYSSALQCQSFKKMQTEKEEKASFPPSAFTV